MPVVTGYPTTPHIPAGWTRAELRALIGRYFGYQRGQATGGSATTLVDASLARFADNYWKGACLYVVEADGAAPQAEETTVVAFSSSSATLTLSPALSAALEAGDTYELFQRVTAAQIHDAINRVCAGSEAVAALKPSATTLDYQLAGIDGLYRPQQIVAVEVRERGNPRVPPCQIAGWTVEDDAGLLTLRLPHTLFANDQLWIVYQLGPDGMQQDDTKTNLPPMLVRARALVYLLENLLTQQDQVGLERYGTLLRDMREQAARLAAVALPRSRRALFYDWSAGRGRLPNYYRIFGDLP